MNLLLTSCGCPGASTLIRYLRKAYGDELRIIGADMQDNVVGQILTDKFYTVPSGNDDNYIDEILDIVEREEIEVILPESTVETISLARNSERVSATGIIPIVSDIEVLDIVSNKYKLYETLRGKIPLPEYRLAKTLDEFNSCVHELGFPDREVCFKPPVGEGSRGFRIISPTIDRKAALLHEKPVSRYITLDEMNAIFKDEDFPELLVMEVVKGLEIDAMTIGFDGEALLTTIKTRERERTGVITYGELIDRPEIEDSVKNIIETVPLRYSVGVQFIEDYLIEINPRVSTFMFQDNLVEIYYSIELARGRVDKEEVRQAKKRIDYGRKMIRYMDQVFFK